MNMPKDEGSWAASDTGVTFESAGWFGVISSLEGLPRESRVELQECSVCFALVRKVRADDHEAWHDGGRGRLIRDARRLLRHLTEVSAAVIAREREAADWTLLLGVEPEQSHLRVLQRVQEITAQAGIPLLNLTGRTTDVLVADASKVRSAARSGEITIGDYTFADAVPVSAEESS